MSNNSKSLLILGRQPELGRAELESLYGPDKLEPVGEFAALVDLPASEIDFSRLGGSLKLATILTNLPSDWPTIQEYLAQNLTTHVANLPSGKFTLGLSVYGLDVSAAEINSTTIKIKKSLKQVSARSIRVVPNKTPALNSAQVDHNKLISPMGLELVLASASGRTWLAQTTAVQDIAAYGARDQARPQRDARVGMLPPKLAQIILNLANPRPGAVVLDPFCGTGVILQEALLMGYEVIGSDLEQRMIEFSQQNIEWLQKNIGYCGFIRTLQKADATTHQWNDHIDAVASETYLGRPLATLPDPAKLSSIVNDVNQILTKFLENLAPQIQSGVSLCLAVPAWRKENGFVELPLIAKLTDMGYTTREFKHAPGKLIYWRDGQVVGRRLLTLTRI